jgi:hypothetical protein
MLYERVADEKDPGAFVQYHQGLRVRFCQGGKAMIKALKPRNRGGAISLRKGLERGVEIRCKTELGGNATKLDDFAAKRERRDELSALQRLGLVRHCDQTFVDAAFPIGRQPPDISCRQPAEITQAVASRRRSRKVSSKSRSTRNAGESGGSNRKDRAATPAPAMIASAEL